MEDMPELAWWVANRQAVKKALGVEHLMLRPSPDGIDFEWYRFADPYVYRTEEIETLKRELSEPIPVSCAPKPEPPKFRFAPQEIRAARRVGPNAPCPCGSGRKHKKCCGR